MRQFDTTQEFKARTIDGKTCVMRWPTDQEWCDRARKKKTVRRDIGHGKAQYDTGNSRKIDVELFGKIRLDKDGPEYDDAESAFALARLDLTQVEAVQIEDGQCIVDLKVPGALTRHTLSIPSQKQVEKYTEASAAKPIFGDRTTELRVFLDPAGPLYDALHISHDGYAGAVPIVHKSDVLQAMLKAVADALEEDDPEE